MTRPVLRPWFLVAAFVLSTGVPARATDLTGVLGSEGKGRFAKCVGIHMHFARMPSRWATTLRSDTRIHGHGALVSLEGKHRLSLSVRTRVDGVAHPEFFAKELFDQIAQHFEGQFEGVEGFWTSDDQMDTNLKAFNKKFREVYPDLLTRLGSQEAATDAAAKIAAVATWTGNRATERGMTEVGVDVLLGEHGNFSQVFVHFDYPPGKRPAAPPVSRSVAIVTNDNRYEAFDNENRDLRLKASVDDRELSISCITRSSSGTRSPVLDEATELRRMFEHLSYDSKTRKIIWVIEGGWDLEEINRLTSGRERLHLDEAIRDVMEGRPILQRGFHVFQVIRSAKYEGKFQRIEIELRPDAVEGQR